MRQPFRFLIAGLMLGVPQLAGAQSAIGPQFQVNTYTTGDQGGVSINGGGCGYWGGRGQDVAADAAGNFIVVWQSSQDGSYRDIFGQRYDSGGTRVGSEFQVNTYTTGDQRYPRVAVSSSGSFVVVWNSQESYYMGLPGTFRDVVSARRFDSTGAPQGPEFQVAGNPGPYYYYTPQYPSVAVDDAGRFVVVWDEFVPPGDGGYRHILGRRYDSTGAPLGSEFEVSQYANYETQAPDVAADPNGEFMVVWHTYSYEVRGRRYDAAATPLGNEFTIQTDGFFEVFPRIAAQGGGEFVVVWNSSTLDPSSDYDLTDVAARRYASSGAPVGPAFRVNSYTPGAQRCVDVSAAADGSFVVTWNESFEKQGLARRFDDAGTPLAGPILVNTSTATDNVAHSLAVAAQTGSDFAVVWTDYGPLGPQGVDGSGLGVFGQRFGTGILSYGDCQRPPVLCTTAPRNRLDMRRRASRDSLAWTWRGGQGISLAQLGDPRATGGTRYVMCLRDGAGTVLFQSEVNAGGTCGSQPCWKPTTGGFHYSRGAQGLRSLLVIGDGRGTSQAVAAARDPTLFTQSLPVSLPVTVQLEADTGACWSTTLSASDVVTNSATHFRALSP